MIARLWRAQIDGTRRAEFEQIGETELVPLLEQCPGFGGVLFLSREPEAALLTLWKDEQSASYFAQGKEVQRLALQLREKGIVHGDPEVEVFAIRGGSFSSNV